MVKHWENINKVLVLGLGYRTGLSTASFLSSEGREVAVSDIKDAKELEQLINKLDSNVKVYADNQDPSLLDQGFDMIVLSPGVPRSIPIVKEACAKGIPVISEIELAYPYIKGRIVAITGTDGKSTTTSLTAHILKELGLSVIMGGNIGIPLISLVSETSDDSVTVIELSSFQLETIDSFRPDAAAILNVSSDHLDRYNSIADYYEAKKRIFMNQTGDDVAVLNADDTILAPDAGSFPSKCRMFSSTNARAHAYADSKDLYLNVKGANIKVMSRNELRIPGEHNVQNTLAAFLLVQACMEKKGIEPDIKALASAAASFPGLEHRMEIVGSYDQREFINDSKATTVHAVEMALRSVNKNAVFIIGGRTKGDDYKRLSELVRERARAVVLMGESTGEFAQYYPGFPMEKAGSMDEAVRLAVHLSQPGDRIILSPACASFDMFSSYEERGRVFRESVEKFRKGELSWT